MFDVLIIGLGSAGYTAAEVGNWPGNIEIKGPDLMENFKKHALSFGDLVTYKISFVKEVPLIDGGFRLTLGSGETVDGRTVLFTTGSVKRKLGIPGEKEFSGKGVTYCATCDAFFYRGKTVAVIGGGDSAVEGAAIAAQVAKQVYLIHRRNAFRAEPFWIDRVKAMPNITPIMETNLIEVLGE